jgi:hypothetical protein
MFKKMHIVYIIVGQILLTTLIALVVMNLVASLALSYKEYVKSALGGSNLVVDQYGDALAEVYPGIAMSEINALLVETWNRPLVYEPVTGMKEAAFSGNYVNVDEAGFRIAPGQGQWPPANSAINIFVFGGSTTFGYGVADADTVPANVQSILARAIDRPVHVYNFGRGHYQSSFERLLFEKLLVSGHVPDIAIFIDGLNDLINNAEFSERGLQLEAAVGGTSLQKFRGFLNSVALARGVRWFRDRFLSGSASAPETQPPDFDQIDGDQHAAIARYLRNVRLSTSIADQFGVEVAFVWQPVPSYGYDLAYHPLVSFDVGRHHYAGRGYEKMKAVLDHGPWPQNFVWCADIQAGLREALYIDAVHYGVRMSKLVAECVVREIMALGLLSPSG